MIRAKDVTTPARMRCSVTSMLNKCGVREATCYGFSPRGLCGWWSSLDCSWALRSVPKWENLGGPAGRTVKLALVKSPHGRQGSGKHLKVILRSVGARKLLSSEKIKTVGGVGFTSQRLVCTWAPGMAEPISQGGLLRRHRHGLGLKSSRTPTRRSGCP